MRAPISVNRRPRDKLLWEKVKASIADGRPSVPAGDVFNRLRAHHRRRLKAAKRDT
jgi:antitoxin ParD1/3/4